MMRMRWTTDKSDEHDDTLLLLNTMYVADGDGDSLKTREDNNGTTRSRIANKVF